MKLTPERVSRYLKQQKKVNDYLLKLTTKNREELILLSDTRHKALESEKALRFLLNSLVRDN